ncbi:hypothetical protein MTO96_029825 [Rhipicephalus appendiculatus]
MITPKSRRLRTTLLIRLEEMLKKTGCIDLHYAVQECMAEHRDWRKCQEAVRNFQMCIERNAKKTGNQ